MKGAPQPRQDIVIVIRFGTVPGQDIVIVIRFGTVSGGLFQSNRDRGLITVTVTSRGVACLSA